MAPPRSTEVSPPTAAHVLLLPFPFQGHINPFVQLGKRLSACGIRATLLTLHHIHSKLLRSQAAEHSDAQLPDHPCTAQLSFVGLPDGLSDHPHTGEIFYAAENLEEAALEFVLSLASQGCPVTCIVSDFFLRWSSSLASRARLPEFVFFPKCVSVLSITLQIDAFIAAGYDPFATSERTPGTGPDEIESVECIAGLPQHLRYADLPFQGAEWKMSTAWQEDVIRRRLKHLRSSQGFLVNSFPALESDVCKALTSALAVAHPDLPAHNFVQMIGPLLHSPSEVSGSSLLEEEVDECMEWLDKQSAGSVVYVAFGSVANLGGSEQLEELARGILDSGQRFLWVLRKDSIKVEEGSLPCDVLEQAKGLGKVVNWAAQVRVLSHSAVGGFFSHCGWNSVVESIHAGVPILGWPFMTDQFPNCRLISNVWKMGLELKRSSSLNVTSSVDIAQGLHDLMQGPLAHSLRSNAGKLQKLSHEALKSAQEFQSFVEFVAHSSYKPLEAVSPPKE